MEVRNDTVTVNESAAAKPLGNWEGWQSDDRSQETCLGVESQIRCLRIDLPTGFAGFLRVGAEKTGYE